MQLEDKTTARKRFSCITGAEHAACEKSDNDDDDPDGGRIQELCDTGTKKPEDNKQFRLDVGLYTVNNGTNDSKTFCHRWNNSQESGKRKEITVIGL